MPPLELFSLEKEKVALLPGGLFVLRLNLIGWLADL